MPTSPSRRAVVAALSVSAAAGLAGCATPWGRLRVQPLGGDPPPTTPPPGPDEVASRAAVSAVSAVLARVDGLDAALAAPLRTALGEQLAALGGASPSAGAPTTGPSAGAAASGTTSTAPGTATPPPTAAGSPAEAVAGLLRDAARTASSDLAGVAGGTARMLACVSAGLEAARSRVLSGVAPPSGGTAPPQSAAPATAAAPASPSGSPTSAAPSGEQGALVAALAVEEAAQYGYGVLAVRLAGGQRDAAVGLLGTHARLVGRLRDDLLALGAQPPAPRPAWALPSPVTDAAGALALAQQLEGASAAAWADVVAAADRQRRAAAAGELVDAAQRWQGWREAAGVQDLVALPGLTGR